MSAITAQGFHAILSPPNLTSSGVAVAEAVAAPATGFQSSKMAAKSHLNGGTYHKVRNARHAHVPTAHPGRKKEKAPVLFGQVDDIQPSFKLLKATSQKPYIHSPFTTQFISTAIHLIYSSSYE